MAKTLLPKVRFVLKGTIKPLQVDNICMQDGYIVNRDLQNILGWKNFAKYLDGHNKFNFALTQRSFSLNDNLSSNIKIEK